MSFPTDEVSTADLRALTDGGFVREDVYRKVFFLQTMADTPFTNLVGVDTINSDKPEWTFDDIPAVADTSVAQASDPASYQAASGSRVSNRVQYNRRAVSVSSTSRNVGTIGTSDQLTYETDKALKALRQDVERAALKNQASVADTGTGTAGKAGGFSAWIKSNDLLGSGGSSGGYNTSTHVVDAATVGTGRALSWAYVQTGLLNAYNARGNPQYLMSSPTLIQGLVKKIVDATIKVATPQATMDATKANTQVGNAYFAGVITELGTQLRFVPNRTQGTYSSAGTSSNITTSVDVFGIDPEQVAMAYLEGYKVTDLGAVSGLHSERDVTVGWTVKPYREDAHFVIRDINPSSTVTV